MNSSYQAFIFLFFLTFSSCSYLPNHAIELFDDVHLQETSEYIHLSSLSNITKDAFVFVPGGLVDPHAYISLMQNIAKADIDVLILKSEANLAILEIGKPVKIKNELKYIENWYLGGHSLGGVSSQAIVHRKPEAFKGLILLGAYPSKSYSIADWDKHVLSIFAEQDLLSTPDEIEANMEFLPEAVHIDSPMDFESLHVNNPATIYYLISGGNHAQFGDYGVQKGDGVATISREEQHEQISAAVINFIVWNE